MGSFASIWGRIGTRLYLALGFAVFLILLSSGVGVYYFERSGDANALLRSRSFPVMDSAWTAVREADVVRHAGQLVLAGSDEDVAGNVTGALVGLDDALARVGGVSALNPVAGELRSSVYDMAGLVDRLQVAVNARKDADTESSTYREMLFGMTADDANSAEALSLMHEAFLVSDSTSLGVLWDRFVSLSQGGIDERVFEIGDGEGLFWVRSRFLVADERVVELEPRYRELDIEISGVSARLIDLARVEGGFVLDAAVSTFDQGRVLLAGISVLGVVAATLVAWVWVGNGILRRLTRLSDRMRSMARGNLSEPVPEVGSDEIGQLARATEVFRQWAFEVQRLNLVEKLYGDLQEAHAELERLQDRLVVQEKLAALGELVSGVAHEIRNPLSFVKNFSEGSQDLYKELVEMLDQYRAQMDSDDVALLDEISVDINDSLQRVQDNGSRLLAVVEQMSSLGVAGGEPVLSSLNTLVRRSVQVGCDTFQSEWRDFDVEAVFKLGPDTSQVMVVGQDFSKAMVNLVTNACYAMHQRARETGDGYVPSLLVRAGPCDEGMEVVVRDNGTGISDEVLPSIFNPFFTTRSGVLGAGLGLMVASDIARRCGGDLTVDTVYGDYAEFRMVLPAA